MERCYDGKLVEVQRIGQRHRVDLYPVLVYLSCGTRDATTLISLPVQPDSYNEGWVWLRLVHQGKP